MIQVNSSELITMARQNNPKAIAQLLNRALAAEQITAKVTRDQNRLTIFVEASTVPPQSSLIGIIRRGMKDLGIAQLNSVRVYRYQSGNSTAIWRDEFFLTQPAPEATLPKSSQPKQNTQLLKRSCQALMRLIQAARQVRISRRVTLGSISFILLALLAYGSVIGWNVFQSRSAQSKTLHKVKTLVAESDPTKANGIDALRTSQAKLKESRDLLRGIPKSLGSLHTEAQAELAKVRTQLESVEQRIAVEESSSKNWETADQLAKDAIASIQNPPHALGTWKTAKANLDKAIEQLAGIPDGTFNSKQVKTKLAEYRKQSTIITQRMTAEQNAINTLQAADNLASQAMEMTSSKYDLQLVDLQNAQSMWQKAITQLKKVPAKSNAFSSIESRMGVYVSNSQKLGEAIQQMQQCLKKGTDTLVSSSCSYTSLDLTKPVFVSPNSYSGSDYNESSGSISGSY